MVVIVLWRGPGNIHGFTLDGKSYRTIALTPTLSVSVGFFIQDETMDFAQSAPQGAH